MGRSPTCCQNTDKSKVCNWIDKGDERLNDCVQMHGEACRRSVSKAAGTLRCGKSCRRRWTSRLRPHLKRGSFAEDEDELIIKLHALLGNRWSLIAGRLPGRTDNEIKNYWNVHLKRELLCRGVDPQTHRPIQQNRRHPSSAFVDLSSTQSQSEQVSDAASSSTEEHPTLNLKLSMGSLPSTYAAPAERDLGNVNTTNEVHSGGRTAINDGLKGLIKPVCHRVSQVMPRTLLLLR